MRIKAIVGSVLGAFLLAWAVVPTAQAVPYAITVSPGTLAFGSVNLGTQKTLKVVVTNSGTAGNVQVHGSYAANIFYYADSTETHANDCYLGNVAVALAPGGSCDLWVTYSAKGDGSTPSKLTVGLSATPSAASSREPYVSSTLAVSKIVYLTATSVAPTYTLTPTSLAFGNVVESTVKVRTTVVKNTSTQNFYVLPEVNVGYPTYLVDYEHPAPGDCLDRDLGSLVIGPGESCKVSVRFAPTAAGAVAGNLNVFTHVASDSNPPGQYAQPSSGPLGKMTKVALTGSGVAPTSTFTPASLNFGNVTIQGDKVLTFVVKNTSPSNVAFLPQGATASPFSHAYDLYQPGDCYRSGGDVLVIAPSGTCVVRERMAPTELGAKKALQSVTTLVNKSWVAGDYVPISQGTNLLTKTVPLQGVGVNPTFTMTPTSLYFGNQIGGTASASKLVTVKNTSTANLTFFVTIDGQGTGEGEFYAVNSGTADQCYVGVDMLVVAPGGSCIARVYFKPSQAGSRKANLRFLPRVTTAAAGTTVPNSNGPYLPSKVVALTGTGVLPAVTFTPASLAFGTVHVGQEKQLTVVVKNNSALNLKFDGYFPAGSGYSVPSGLAFQPTDCFRPGANRVIAPGQSCNIRVRFNPTTTGSSPLTVAIRFWRTDEPAGTLGVADGDLAGSKNIAITGTGG